MNEKEKLFRELKEVEKKARLPEDTNDLHAVFKVLKDQGYITQEEFKDIEKWIEKRQKEKEKGK